MNKQSPWLFEAPLASESGSHSNQAYYSNLEGEGEWELQEANPYGLGEEEWERSPGSSPRGQTIRETVSGFSRYSNAIPPQERAKIARIAQIIIQSHRSGLPIRTIRLVGHADRDVQRRANFEKKISSDRALQVQQALIKVINNRAILSTLSWQREAAGSNQLAVQNTRTEGERQLNRRVEIILATSPKSPDILPPKIPDRWRLVLGGSKVRAGNQVEFLIDGHQTFEAMVNAIRTATEKQHYIYLLGWWLDDSFPIIPADPTSTIRELFSTVSKKGVQVRAMLWDRKWLEKDPISAHNKTEVERINSLPTGGAILDDSTVRIRKLPVGSHHQKVLIVKGNQGLITFCGGIDIHRDRIYTVSGSSGSSGGKGSPLHDVHCQIVGPAAHDLLRVFIDRWRTHPEHNNIDASKGTLFGLKEPVPAPVNQHFVRIAQTFNLVTSSTSCIKARSVRSVITNAIRAARRFIYIQDQYLVNMEIATELQKALPNIKHLTVVIPPSEISDLQQVWSRTKAFIDFLTAGPGAEKVRIFYLINPASGGFGPYTYIHSKTWIIDDELAIIGSANSNRRGWSCDSEVIAAIFDGTSRSKFPFAQQLRMRLWSRHLNVPLSAVTDGVASSTLWLQSRVGAWNRPYDPNSGRDSKNDRIWDLLIDPSADHLPPCSGGVETESRIPFKTVKEFSLQDWNRIPILR